MLRYFTAGETHGKCLTVIIEGVPAGFKISLDEINELEESIENPETGDSLILNIIFLSIFVILSSYAFKKILNKE